MTKSYCRWSHRLPRLARAAAAQASDRYALYGTRLRPRNCTRPRAVTQRVVYCAYSCAMSNNSTQIAPEGRRRQRRGAVGRPGDQRAGDPGAQRRGRRQRGRRRDRRAQVHRLPAAGRAGGARPGRAEPATAASTSSASASLRLASAIPGRLDLVRAGPPGPASELAEEFDETVNLAVLRSHYAVNVDQARGPGGRGHPELGRPADAAARHLQRQGPAGPPRRRSARDALLDEAGLARFTADTITASNELDSAARRRARGRATRRRSEEFEIGLNAMAVPVRDHTARWSAPSASPGPPTAWTRAGCRTSSSGSRAAGRGSRDRMGHLALTGPTCGPA